MSKAQGAIREAGVRPLNIELDGPEDRGGYRVLAALLRTGSQAVESLKREGPGWPSPQRAVGLARIRGTGPGVSFSSLVHELESVLPREPQFPFEGSDRVGGAVWSGDLVQPRSPHGLAKLHWEQGADDLPMHTHESSDRCIVVLSGRGFFHVSEEPCAAFSGQRVRTIAARERDVFVFTRGVVHTFSTSASAMTLLSCQLPFVPFEDARQYALPSTKWIAREHLHPEASRIELQWAVGG